MSTSPPLQQGFVRTDDGMQLYWKQIGEGGGPALVCCNGVGVSTFFWKYLVRRFAPERAVILWDYRGHGRSSLPGPEHRVDIPRMAMDLGCLLDSLEIAEAVLLGHSMGSQVILERYRQRPGGIVGLVSVLGTFGHPLDTFGDLAFSRQIFDVVLHAAGAAPTLFDAFSKLVVATPLAYDLSRLLNLVDAGRMSRHDLRQYTHHLADMGFDVFFRFLAELGEHGAGDILPGIAVPTLVVAAEFDGFTPYRLAESMAEAIPGSEYLLLKGASHAGIVEQPEAIHDAISAWLVDRLLPTA